MTQPRRPPFVTFTRTTAVRHKDVSLDNAVDLSESTEPNESEVHPPNLEDTVRLLEQRRIWLSFTLTALLILGCVYTLYFAEGFFAPVFLAVVFNFFLSPFVRALTKIRIPEAVGAVVVMLFGCAILAFFVYELSGPLSEWLERAPQVISNISADIQRFKKPVEKVTQAGEQVSRITQVNAAEQAKKPPAQVVVTPPGPFDGLLTKTRETVWGAVVFLVMLYFLLSSGDLFLRKLIHVLPRFEDKKRAVLIMREIENHISKYLITVAIINACLGTAGALVFWALGMPNPALWGALGFLLNFIPYLGALTEMIVVGVVASATFPNLGHALLVPAAYLGLGTLEANLITPYIMGRRMTLNPVVVFAAVTFGGFLWGILGVFLAVPALVMLKIFCDHIESLAPIGEFLGN